MGLGRTPIKTRSKTATSSNIQDTSDSNMESSENQPTIQESIQSTSLGILDQHRIETVQVDVETTPDVQETRSSLEETTAMSNADLQRVLQQFSSDINLLRQQNEQLQQQNQQLRQELTLRSQSSVSTIPTIVSPPK